MNAGDVFQLVGVADIHAWVIISDPRDFPEEVLIVNFTSWDPRHDQTCVLDAGRHPFINARTCVNFPGARVTTNAALDQLNANGRLNMHQPVSAALLREIREAAVMSTRIAIEKAEILFRQRLVEE